MSDAIERIEWKDLGVERFDAKFGKPLKPVIVKGAIDHWQARGKWTPDFFRKKHGDREVTVDGMRWKLGSLIDKIEGSSLTSTAPYLRNELLDKWPKTLHEDVSPIPLCTQGNWLEAPSHHWLRRWLSPELYIGGAGAKFPVLHYDQFHLHAFLMQLYGDKEYLVYAPNQLNYMYRGEGELENKSMVNDPENPDLSRFPGFAIAKGFRFRLHPGETLFVPCGWWHTAKILSTSITVSLNGVSSSNWKEFSDDLVQDISRDSLIGGYKTRVRLAITNWRQSNSQKWQ